MARYDFGIYGWGLLPLLLARHLLTDRQETKVLLLCADRTVGGETTEPVRVNALSQRARDLTEPYCVREWPGFYIARDGAIEQFDEPVWLLDPVQTWLDLQEQAERCTMLASSPLPDQTALYPLESGPAEVRHWIDLSPLTEQRCETEILGMEAVRQLGLPILADYDTALPGWEANQLLPLGDERVMVRKLPERKGLLAANSSFESLLNALVNSD